MTIKKIITKTLKKLKVKYPYSEEDNFNFDIQLLKNSLKGEIEDNDGEKNIEKFFFHIFKNFKFSKSQLFQDLFVDFILKKETGFYCEVGACDGKIHSNTYYLEYNKKWKGILCEPAHFWLNDLKNNRPNAIIETSPIFTSSNIDVEFFERPGGRSFINQLDIRKENQKSEKMKSISLNDLFTKNNVNSIDYLSLDTEGSEYDILKSLDFFKFRPKIITIEHNYKKYREKVFSCLIKNDYKRVFKSISRFDDWYIDNQL